MQVEYDKKVDAKYIRIRKGKVVQTEKKEAWLLFDRAENGEVLGVEILNSSKHPVSIFTTGNTLVGYGYQNIRFSPLGHEKEDQIAEMAIPSKNLQYGDLDPIAI